MADAILNWVDADKGTVLDGNTVGPGKLVQMRERDDDAVRGPASFELSSHLGSFVERVRQHVGFDPHSTPVTRLSTEKIGLGRWRSEFRWSAGLMGSVNQMEYFFRCNDGLESPSLMVSAVGFSVMKRGANAGLAVSVGGVLTGSVGAESKTTKYVCKATVDPSVHAQLLVPWGLGGASLRSFLVDYLSSLGLPEANSILEEDIEGFLPTRRPEGWEFHVEPMDFLVVPGAEQEITVSIVAPTAGRAAFALMLSDAEDSNRFVVSNVLEMDVEMGMAIA
jgi:hypothetical protein